jgi:hypothetical protein
VETSKSAKRVARVAKQSAKTKVRTQRGLLFPITMVAVIALGALLVVYARQGTTVSAAVAPKLNDDHWHVAYGVYVCKEFKTAIQTQNELVNGVSLGIHTHGDGVIHIHPFASNAAGRNAKLGVFFKAAGVKASTGKMAFPEDIGTYQNTTDTCEGKAATWKLAYWADAAQTGAPTIFVADFANVRFTQDRGAMTLAFVPDDVDVATLKPPSIPTLDQLTDVSTTTTTAAAGETTTTVAGATATTAVGDTATAATTAASTAATTAAATTTATTAAVTTTTSG